MDARERKVLESLRFDAVPTEQTLWSGQLPHTPRLNQPVYDRVRRELESLRHAGMVDSPPGLVIHGEFGSGKSHLVWWARRYVAGGMHGYYFNIQPDGNPDSLWKRTVSSIVRDLLQPLGSPDEAAAVTQLELFMRRLTDNLDLSSPAQDVLSGRQRVDPVEARGHLRDFTESIRSRHPSPAVRDVALALALLAIHDEEANDAGWEYLHGSAEEIETRRQWGLRRSPDALDEVVRHLSSLLAMTGPSLFIVDQIDDLVGRSSHETESAGRDEDSGDLAAALMTIREKLTRSITLISCLEHTWQTIQRRALRSAPDRFHEALELEPIPGADVGRDLMARFLGKQFEQLDFEAPHATWPVSAAAFDSVKNMRPRRLIQSFGAHVRACLAADEVVPLNDFEALAEPESAASETGSQNSRMHQRFLDHRQAVMLDPLKETRAEKDLADVLTAAVRALTIESDALGGHRVKDTCRRAENSSTHCEMTAPAGMRLYVRGVNTVAASAVGNRLDKARELAFADAGAKNRLLIAHTNPWKVTDRVREALGDLSDAGGQTVEIGDDALRTLRAVQLTTAEDTEEVREWLRSQRPISASPLGRKLMEMLNASPGDDKIDEDGEGSDEAVAAATGETPSSYSPSPDAIPLGRDADGAVMDLRLPELRKHVAVFAASGSGKTVLLRRIIEECALREVSTIVLDPNNDLARLGDAWPQPPQSWWPGDAERSREYLDNTDVVVWTPGVSKGNPLTLQAFPDFTAVRDDPDELRLAVDTAVASLAPRARIEGENHLADGRRAVLRATLLSFARRGGGDLADLVELLGNPPSEVFDLPSAAKHAAFVASALSYARANDPLFEGDGTPFDPDQLLTPTPGYRARVSVINLAGVPDENRPAFINRLQMALFSWIKRNPARDRPLNGLFIMDEAQTFIPSGRNTPCTESTRNLASQARKYGLGLVYATQAPRGIDSRITGNAASHVYGRVTVPAHVSAVNDMAGARGEAAPRVSQLSQGRFYASLEGVPLTETAVPMCLSHHGPPLEEGEIVQRAWARR